MISNEGLDTDILAVKERPPVYGIIPKNIANCLFIDLTDNKGWTHLTPFSSIFSTFILQMINWSEAGFGHGRAGVWEKPIGRCHVRVKLVRGSPYAFTVLSINVPKQRNYGRSWKWWPERFSAGLFANNIVHVSSAFVCYSKC